VYVGSTTRQLSERFGEHKRKGNKTSSKQIIDIGDAYIELIKLCPCDSKEELLKREGEIIRRTECVNKEIAGRTAAEYHVDNCNEIRERKKKYYTDNRGEVREKKKKYYAEHREEVKERKNKYRERNREEIKKKDNEKIVCECGAVINRSSKTRHMRSIKHIYDFIHS